MLLEQYLCFNLLHFGILFDLLTSRLNFGGKDEARNWFAQLRQRFLDLNGAEWQSDAFGELEAELRKTMEDKRAGTEENALDLVENARS